MKNKLIKDWGYKLVNEKYEVYEINKVVIFKDNEAKVIANYFLDNFANNEYEVTGDVQRKLKIDLSLKTNFIAKSETQDAWKDHTQYTLYLNGELNNYEFEELELNGQRLDLKYNINGLSCRHCIGWNNKKQNEIDYHTFKDLLSEISIYRIDNEEMGERIEKLGQVWREYNEAKELENSYTALDFNKMSLASGTTEEENKTMLRNNGFIVNN